MSIAAIADISNSNCLYRQYRQLIVDFDKSNCQDNCYCCDFALVISTFGIVDINNVRTLLNNISINIIINNITNNIVNISNSNCLYGQ